MGRIVEFSLGQPDDAQHAAAGGHDDLPVAGGPLRRRGRLDDGMVRDAVRLRRSLETCSAVRIESIFTLYSRKLQPSQRR